MKRYISNIFTLIFLISLMVNSRQVQAQTVEYDNYVEFFDSEIYQHEKPFTLWIHRGYEVEYEESESYFDKSFRTSVLEQINRTPEGGTAFIVLRGTEQGVNSGRKVIDEIRKDPKRPKPSVDIKIIDIATNKISTSELAAISDVRVRLETEGEGLKEFHPDYGNTTSRGVDLLISASNMSGCKDAKFIAWQGDRVVLTEIGELVSRAETGGKGGGNFTLELNTWGMLEPAGFKATQAINGYYAASQAALSLSLKESSLSLGKLSIKAPTSSGSTLASFLKADYGQRLLRDYEMLLDPANKGELVKLAIFNAIRAINDRGLSAPLDESYAWKKYQETKELIPKSAELFYQRYLAMLMTDTTFESEATVQTAALSNRATDYYTQHDGKFSVAREVVRSSAPGLNAFDREYLRLQEEVRRVQEARVAMHKTIAIERAAIIARAAEKGGKK